MKKLVLPITLVVASALSFHTATTFDLDKTKASIEKNIKQAKETVKKEVEKVADTASWFSIQNLLGKNIPIAYLLIIAFLIGLAASFTPCIYPMIPITIGILQSQASTSLARNFLLATSYVAGMATVYATLGYFAATTTLMLGQWLANPWVILLLILLFLYLAFSMFGFYEIYMPKFMRGGKTVKVKGSFLYSFLFGAISGTAASPCLTPPLALLLGYVAKVGNPIVGFFTLFTFAFGLGVLLIIVGTFSNTITSLPRAGAWMNEIKKFFGFLLIGVSIYFLQTLVSPAITTMLYILLLIITLGYYGITIGKRFRS